MSRVNEGLIVTGLPELTRALRALHPAIAKELRLAMKDIASGVVARAQGRMEFGAGGVGASVKAGAGTRGAWINFPKGGPGSGGTSDGHYPWLDFGGGKATGRGVTASSGGGSRRATTSTGGRYVYPGIDDARRSGLIEDQAYAAINRARKRLQLDGEGFS